MNSNKIFFFLYFIFGLGYLFFVCELFFVVGSFFVGFVLVFFLFYIVLFGVVVWLSLDFVVIGKFWRRGFFFVFKMYNYYYLFKILLKGCYIFIVDF